MNPTRSEISLKRLASGSSTSRKWYGTLCKYRALIGGLKKTRVPCWQKYECFFFFIFSEAAFVSTLNEHNIAHSIRILSGVSQLIVEFKYVNQGQNVDFVFNM
jgi:hypothetical protein